MDTEPDVSAKPAQAKRGWFQFHLSTALALMITAGLLIWANIANGRNYNEFACGWPFVCFLDWTAPNQNFYFHEFIFDCVANSLVLLLVGFVFEARHWKWSGGKIFVWIFIGAAVSLHILHTLFTMFNGVNERFGTH